MSLDPSLRAVLGSGQDVGWVYIFGPSSFETEDLVALPFNEAARGLKVKVGKSTRPKNTLMELRRGNPADFIFHEMLFAPDIYSKLEVALHRFWRAFRFQNEFFVLPREEIDFFAELRMRDFRSLPNDLLLDLCDRHEALLGTWLPEDYFQTRA